MKNSYSELIYKAVKKIPKGKVTTYGQIAEAIRQIQNSTPLDSRWHLTGQEIKINPRYVGYVLHNNPDPKNIPCHRVVDRKGKLAENYAFGGWKKQKEKLVNEGVLFKDEMHVDLEKSLWAK